MLTYLARAYFEAGRLQEAKSTLMKAMHLKPTNQATQYNLALTHMQAASIALKKTAPSSAELRGALSDLNHAVKCDLSFVTHRFTFCSFALQVVHVSGREQDGTATVLGVGSDVLFGAL